MCADSTPIVLTIRGAISWLLAGGITSKGLEGAIFYFDCTRLYGAAPADSELVAAAGDDLDKGKRLHGQLMVAVAVAQERGRVRWRENNSRHHDFEGLNELLERNGLPTIQPLQGPSRGELYQSAVERAVEEQKLPYRIVA